jgi:putative endopeptidase
MDPVSNKSFNDMADCVDHQYSSFYPVPGFPIDGRQTLGENLADNGGIRAAYNAFEAYQNFLGPDARLPDSEFDAFTPEQLFFLGFARIWCETNPSEERLRTQVLVDPHSPSQFRVKGTIQNFPAFRAAFNCPVGDEYSPANKNHCNVWASETKVVTGIPPVKDVRGKVNNINPPQEKDSEV